ncbi:MAG: DUF3604 domain-containing protein [Gammaproteobacteria bacterium]|nr:DUF3604 domain-containing protein [Gammaproteobacteria bacterium]
MREPGRVPFGSVDTRPGDATMRNAARGWLVTGALAATMTAGAAEHVYFGDLHLHTRYSNDAWTGGETRTPDDSYRFAKGEPLEHVGGTKIQLNTPLDFLGVSDHAEMLGAFHSLAEPGHPDAESAVARQAASAEPDMLRQALMDWARSMRHIDPNPVLFNRAQEADVWGKIVATADRHYAPGEFTTFAAFEWTSSMPDFGNLHRVVVFEGTDDLPHPYSRVDSIHPEDLWSYLEAQRMRGVDAIAIPHNSNVSNGHMFALTDSFGEPLNAHYAARRTRNEPMLEVSQHKGTSETHPALSPNDEFAGFELYTRLLSSLAGERYSEPRGSYVREAYLNGIALQARSGFNPFRFGLSGGSDYHSGVSAIEEDNLSAASGPFRDGTPEQRMARPASGMVTGASGLTAAWADENTREAIFAAFRRSETYGTTGTRIRVRFFGGWDFEPSLVEAGDRTARAYAGGVPMGGVLRGDTSGDGDPSGAPTLAVWAAKDARGGNLDRLQIVKGSLREGVAEERIFDVALGGENRRTAEGVRPVGNTVDLATATYDNTIGAATLAAVWEDPEFDPTSPAFYYVRVLEIPTPRWTLYDSVATGIPLPEGVPATLQERAFTSPIWYLPTRR